MSNIDYTHIILSVLSLWASALPAIFIGCLLNNYLRGTALWKLSDVLFAPLTKISHLPKTCGAFFMLSFINRYTARTLLADMLHANQLTESQVLFAYLNASFFTGLNAIVFYVAPAAFPSLGWHLGAIYTGMYFLVQLSVFIIGLLWSRHVLNPPKQLLSSQPDTQPARKMESPRSGSPLKQSCQQFWSLAKVFMLATFVSYMLINMPVIQQTLSGPNTLFTSFGLRSETLLILVAGIPSFIGGIGIAGPLISEGMMPEYTAVATLLTAAVMHDLFDLWSGTLPTNMSIFGNRLGIWLTACVLSLRIAFTIFFVWIIFYFT